MILGKVNLHRYAAWALFALVLVYAFLAGLRTIADFDTGWLLATGRYVVTHREIPRTELFSYTAYGTDWIYPPFAGVAFYLLYMVGGFAALSWLNATACAATVALCLRRPRIWGSVLAMFAVPVIALRTAPRGDLFTTVFFALFVWLLWAYHRSGRAPLWALPVVMLLWANVHPGFAAGLALTAGYVGLELLELPFASRRAEAVARLKRAAPWLVATALVTLVNPWGPKLYRTLILQSQATPFQSGFGSEWSGVRLSVANIMGALAWRNPDSSSWWLLFCGAAIAVIAIRRGRWGAAALLLGCAYVAINHWRFLVPFAIVTIIVGGDLLAEAWRDRPPALAGLWRGRVPVMAGLAAVFVLGVVRIADTVSNRTYLANGELSLFGTGLSWWYPQRAAAFIAGNDLPANLFHHHNGGGYVTLRLGPKYRDYDDSRVIPFGVALLQSQRQLMRTPPDSRRWIEEADGRGINTILAFTARFAGLEWVPLKQYCESKQWQAVYLDEVSIVLVRRRPENARWLQKFSVDCGAVRFTPPAVDASSARGRGELYNFFTNAASVYYVLGRAAEAGAALDRAAALFQGDPNLPLLRGQLLEDSGRTEEARQQYLLSLRWRPTAVAWYLLGRLYAAQKDYERACAATEQATQLAIQPADYYRMLGQIYLTMRRPQEALSAFDAAEQSARGYARWAEGEYLRAQLAEGRARAWGLIGDLNRAVAYQQESVKLAPHDPRKWELLAAMYAAQGRTDEAADAHRRAKDASEQISY